MISQVERKPVVIANRLVITRRLANALMLATTLLVMLAHLVYLNEFPLVFLDEGWMSNAAWHWLKTGENIAPMYSPVLDQFESPSVIRFYLGQLPYSAVFAVLGVGFFEARLASWLMGGAILVVVILIGWQHYSKRTGVLAALFLSVSAPFLYASHYARQDVWLALIVVFSYWIITLGIKYDRWWMHVLGSFLIAVSPDIHQYGVLFIPGVIGLYLLAYGRRLLVKRGTWLAAAGGLAGFLVFAALHLWPDITNYFELLDVQLGGEEGVSALPLLSPLNLAHSLIGEFANRYDIGLNGINLALIAAGVVLLLMRRSKVDRPLLVFTGLAFAMMVFIVDDKGVIYGILLYPFFMLIVAEGLTSMLNRTRDLREPFVFTVIMLLAAVGKDTFVMGREMIRYQEHNYYTVTDVIREVIPADARVLGMPSWWFGLHDHEYISSFVIPYFRFYNDYSVAEALAAARPDIIIVDSLTGTLLTETKEQLPSNLRPFHIPRDEFNQFLAERARLLHTFDDPFQDEFFIYAVEWGEDHRPLAGGA
jgi:4-amino-4-deoxy-L-arabinose transferase-like glycosyltransferase